LFKLPELLRAAPLPRHHNTPRGNVMSYSQNNAAAACGIYKSTVLRSIKAGRLTATKDALGQWRIEPAELHRVYPPAQSNDADANPTRHDAATGLRAALAEQRMEDLKAMLDDVRVQRDKWQQQAERSRSLMHGRVSLRPAN
jgi:hypothetical protein